MSKIIPKDVKILKPLPSPILKVKGLFRYQILLSSKYTAKITKPIKYILRHAKLPKEIKIIIDVDALTLS